MNDLSLRDTAVIRYALRMMGERIRLAPDEVHITGPVNSRTPITHQEIRKLVGRCW